jgi:hypothetical protein
MKIDPQETNRTSFAIFMPLRTTILEEAKDRKVPVMISSEQAYYWSKAWQDAEIEAEEDLKAGRSRIFKTGQDAAEWLLSDNG